MPKLPPIEKVYEAWTALTDNRVKLNPDNSATVESSDGAKSYTIRFSGDKFSSDDNATYWRGYPGYPVIAVLMLQGRLPYDKDEAALWNNVNWKEINTRFKNNYAEAVAEVAAQRNIDLARSQKAAEQVMEALQNLPIEIKRKI